MDSVIVIVSDTFANSEYINNPTNSVKTILSDIFGSPMLYSIFPRTVSPSSVVHVVGKSPEAALSTVQPVIGVLSSVQIELEIDSSVHVVEGCDSSVQIPVAGASINQSPINN